MHCHCPWLGGDFCIATFYDGAGSSLEQKPTWYHNRYQRLVPLGQLPWPSSCFFPVSPSLLICCKNPENNQQNFRPESLWTPWQRHKHAQSQHWGPQRLITWGPVCKQPTGSQGPTALSRLNSHHYAFVLLVSFWDVIWGNCFCGPNNKPIEWTLWEGAGHTHQEPVFCQN